MLGISLGQIIGTGVVVLTGISINMTGAGAPWAFFLALAIVAIPTLCIAALGSAVPKTGGNYTYVRDLLGSRTAFVYLCLLIAGQLILASFAIGFADYAKALWPNINTTLIAACVMTCCYVANLLGLKTATRLQNLMVLALLLSLLAYIGFGLSHIETYQPYFTPPQVFPNGIAGFFAAAFLLRLSLIGSEYVSEFGGEMKNPGRTIPMVMMISLVCVTGLYFGIALVATGVLPLSQVQGKNLAVVAKEIFSPEFYALFIVGGVMLSLVTSLNAIFAWCTRGISMATKDGWFPIKLAAQNRYGTPYIFLSLFYVVGMVPIVSGMSLDLVAILGNAVGAIFGLFPVFAVFNLPKRQPDAYNQALFRLPIWANKVLPILAVIIYAYGIWVSRSFIGPKGFSAIGIYLVIIFAYMLWRYPYVQSYRPTN